MWCNAEIAKLMKEEKVHQFLMGLDDDSFSTIWSQILAVDSLPSLDKIFDMVQQEKNHHRMMTTRDHKYDEGTPFAVTQPNKVAFQLQRARPICGHCRKIGHVEVVCYELIGYPSNWNVRGGRNSYGRGRAGEGEDGPTLAEE